MDTFHDSLDDYLVALAEGVARAQGRLDGAPPGTVAYHIPRLDFELKLTIDVASTGAGKVPARLAVRPPSMEHAELLSTVRGSLVATPVDAGRSRPRLALDLRNPSQAEARRLPRAGHAQVIVVRVVDNAGRPVPGMAVTIDLDREASAILNREAGLPAASSSDSWVADVALVTAADGTASTVLHLSPTEPAGASAVIVADAAGQTRTVVYQLPKTAGVTPRGLPEEPQ